MNSPDQPPAVDLGIIRCICSSVEDDGFTIQCERCLVWQHAFCVNITQFSIPEHYLCERCSKRKRPKLSKRIPISKKKFKHLDAVVNEEEQKKKKKRLVKSSRIVSRYVYPLFKDAKERWKSIYLDKQDDYSESPLLIDYGPFVFMDTTTLQSKGYLLDTPVYNNSSIYASSSIPSGRYLMEITGDILLKSEFKFDPTNDFVLLGTPLSHIMFYPTLDVCIDTRQFGNKAKYIRRSCHPNAELRNIIVPNGKTIHLGLFARHLIERGQEVTIGWNWQRGHITWKENMNWHQQHKQKSSLEDNRHKVIDEEEERRRKLAIRNMLDRFEKEFGTCACLNKRRCLIEHLKRQCIIKEKPSVKRSNVNIATNTKAGRRKSSIILLKPRPELDKLKSQKVISPTIHTNSHVSDDELLDVEGDIDIENDIPMPLLDNAPPLLDDHSSDEENADLSSLASLSSLSVFEESDSEEIKTTETPPDAKKLIPALLPRKKLWMRDYLNKHSNPSPKEENGTIDESIKDTNKEPTKEDSLKEESTEMELTEDVAKEEPIKEDLIKESSTLDDTDDKLEEEPIVVEEEEDTSHKQELFDLNEDELSDASTVLLDDEEINNVYQSKEASTSAAVV